MTPDRFPDDRGHSRREDAACREHPAEWFTGPHAPGDTRRAIDVCTTCPVRKPCLDAALGIDVSADIGIWGGTTPATRRRLRREGLAPVTRGRLRPVSGESLPGSAGTPA